MAGVHEATVSVVHEFTLSLVHEITLPAMRIEPTRPTTSTARVHQIYTVLRNLQERYSLPDRLVATVIESLELFLQG